MWHTLTRSCQRLGLEDPRSPPSAPVRRTPKFTGEGTQHRSPSPPDDPGGGRPALWPQRGQHTGITGTSPPCSTGSGPPGTASLSGPPCPLTSAANRPNHTIYYVCGAGADGQKPAGFYPTVDDFIGEGGTFLRPRAVFEGRPGLPAGSTAAGREAMGAFRFDEVTLAPGQEASYVLLLGIAAGEDEAARVLAAYGSTAQAEAELEAVRRCWQEKVNVSFRTGDRDFDSLMQWVCFQPFLRRLFGCSFLPHHDYGRGGRGWRDPLAGLPVPPADGPRRRGPNDRKELWRGADRRHQRHHHRRRGRPFIADRNGIARVWMDHAPLAPDDYQALHRPDRRRGHPQPAGPLFQGRPGMRGTAIDGDYRPEQGCCRRTGRARPTPALSSSTC